MKRPTLEEIQKLFAYCSECKKVVVFKPLGEFCDYCEGLHDNEAYDSCFDVWGGN